VFRVKNFNLALKLALCGVLCTIDNLQSITYLNAAAFIMILLFLQLVVPQWRMVTTRGVKIIHLSVVHPIH
jgi:hypothetical protein